MARARAANSPAEEWVRDRSEGRSGARYEVGEDMGGDELPRSGGNAGLGWCGWWMVPALMGVLRFVTCAWSGVWRRVCVYDVVDSGELG